MQRQLGLLKTNQTPVTRLPRLLTELPFFYLTKKADTLTRPIDFRAEDSHGRPLTWKVHPNFGPAIGPPSLLAHEVWVRLIKPSIDGQKRLCGFIPSLIPLGGVRACLRTLGWSYGGHQAKSLIRAINQIGGAWCEANLWLPTSKNVDEAESTWRSFHASFSRLSLYAIGANHLTEEDIRGGRVDFTFDLDDVLYVKLDPVEMRILEMDVDRPIDNEYLFSLSPAARRWYELMAPKFFGVISNHSRSRGYCEIRYSWYVSRHHTLRAHVSRKRRVQQMNEVIAEHLECGFVQKVEYQSVREGNRDEIVIRYYPGKFAFKVTRRISESLRAPKGETRFVRGGTQPSGDGTVLLEDKLTNLGVAASKARELVRKRRAVVERQLLALPYRERTGIRDKAGWLVRAIEKDFDLPEPMVRVLNAERESRESKEKRSLEIARQNHENQYKDSYKAYLEVQMESVRQKCPKEYERFLSETENERYQNSRLIDSPEIREALLQKIFVDFFHHHKDNPLLTFWEWDSSLNPKPFQQ